MKLRKFGKNLLVCILLVCIFGNMSSVTAQAAVNPGSAIARGIDVSKYQGAVNWGAVAGSGMQFAFVKIGSSKSGIDPMFHANMAGANAAGLKVGAYVYSYATTPEAAAAEAAFAVDALKNYTVSYPVVFDLEDSVHKGMTPDQLAALANSFCAVVDAAGYYPMVYSSKNWMTGRIGATPYDKWIAQYSDACDYPGGLAFWQATAYHKINGVAGNVDLNYQYKDYSALIISDGWLAHNNGLRFYRGYKMQTGWIDINGLKYYSDNLGYMQKGWQQLDEKGMRYFYESGELMGAMAVGFNTIGDKTYYFNPEGYMQTGWITVDGARFLLDPAGAMIRGWYQDGVSTYYFNETGVMATNWTAINGKLYYFTADGKLSPNTFVDVAGAKYYAGADGAMVTGRQVIGASSYLFGEDGVMKTGLQVIDGNMYFYNVTGEMIVNNWVDLGGGVKTYAGVDGAFVRNGFYTIGDYPYYFNQDGVLVTNTILTIDGISYAFDANGVWLPIEQPAMPVVQ